MIDLAARLSGARLDALPQAAHVEEYRSAAEELEAALRALPGAVAVYGMGAVSAPGISDLDRIVVVRRGGSVPNVWPKLARRTRQLAMHAPFLVDVDTFARHRAFAHVEPLAHLWGERVDIEEPGDAEARRLLLGAEGAAAVLLVLVRQALGGRVRVRSTLCALHGLRHDLELAGLGPDDAPAAFALAGAVSELRATWFGPAGPPVTDLRGVLGRALPALAETLGAIERRLARPGSAPAALRLGGGWSNVRLVPGERLELVTRWAPRVGWLPPRVAQRAFRARTWQLAVPSSLLMLLGGAPPERVGVVHRYCEFLRQSGAGYSAIGFATTFAPQ